MKIYSEKYRNKNKPYGRKIVNRINIMTKYLPNITKIIHQSIISINACHKHNAGD